MLLVCHAASKKLTTSLQMLLISQINLLVLESDWNSTLNFIASSKSGFLNDIYRVHEHKKCISSSGSFKVHISQILS